MNKTLKTVLKSIKIQIKYIDLTNVPACVFFINAKHTNKAARFIATSHFTFFLKNHLMLPIILQEILLY